MGTLNALTLAKLTHDTQLDWMLYLGQWDQATARICIKLCSARISNLQYQTLQPSAARPETQSYSL